MNFLAKHKYLTIGAAVFVLIILLRKSTTAVGYVAEKAKTSSVFKVIGSVLGVATAIAFLATLFDGAFNGGFSALIGSGVLAAGALMPFRGVVDLFSRSNNIVETLTLGSSSGEKVFKIQPNKLVDNGAPIKVKGILINLKFTLTSAATTPGDPVYERMFGRLLQYAEVWSPLLGTLVDRQYATGPVLYHLAETIGLGYKKITPRIDRFTIVAGTPHEITVPFYVPLSTAVIAEPLDSMVWAGFLDQAELRINASDSHALREYESVVTISAMTASAHLVTTVDRRSNAWQIPGIFSLASYYVTCNSGQKNLDFDAGGSGPNATDLTRGERLLFVGLQSNRSGLAGPDSFRGLSRVGCPSLGIDDTLVPDAYVTALSLSTGEAGTRRMLGPNRTPLTDASGQDGLFFESAFYQDPSIDNEGDELVDIDEGPAGGKLRVLPIYAAGLGQRLSQLPVFRPGKLQINLEKTTMPSSGQWALTVLSMRDVRTDVHEKLARLAGAVGVVDRALSDGKSAVRQVMGGRDRLDFVGMPYQLKMA